MLPAFFSLDGRSLAAHVAIVVACATAAKGVDTALIRMIQPDQPSLFPDHRIDDAVQLVELASDRVSASMRLDEALTETLRTGKRVILDLPGFALGDGALRRRPGLVPVIPVGPAPLDAHIVRSALWSGAYGPRPDRSDHAGGSEGKPWLLPCGRSGGLAAVRSFSSIVNDGHEAAARLPVLPVALPIFTGFELPSIASTAPTTWPLRQGEAVLDALERAGAPGAGVSEEMPVGPGGPDDRDAAARLRDLADDLQAHLVGLPPEAARLRDAPLLEDWSWAVRGVTALSGRIVGHPDIRSGRRRVTSEVYASDGETWARTYSRLYRLGLPAWAGRVN